MKGLAPHTAKIIETISQLDCIKPYVLVGGTALSLQIGARLSEDLDFMSWRSRRDEKREVDWPEIKRQLEAHFVIQPMIDLALKYSGHRLKTKNLLAMLTNHEHFVQDSNFEHLHPTYDITPKEISNRIALALGSYD